MTQEHKPLLTRDLPAIPGDLQAESATGGQPPQHRGVVGKVFARLVRAALLATALFVVLLLSHATARLGRSGGGAVVAVSAHDVYFQGDALVGGIRGNHRWTPMKQLLWDAGLSESTADFWDITNPSIADFFLALVGLAAFSWPACRLADAWALPSQPRIGRPRLLTISLALVVLALAGASAMWLVHCAAAERNLAPGGESMSLSGYPGELKGLPRDVRLWTAVNQDSGRREVWGANSLRGATRLVGIVRGLPQDVAPENRGENTLYRVAWGYKVKWKETGGTSVLLMLDLGSNLPEYRRFVFIDPTTDAPMKAGGGKGLEWAD